MKAANIRRSSLLLASVLAVLLGYAVAASAATDVGYRDGSFNATSVDIKDKVIRVTGTVSDFKGSPQVLVDDEKQLEVIKAD